MGPGATGASMGAAVAETHSGVVFFLGDRAYKLKKPVTFGFLDFSSRAVRQATCQREVELNRRLAPDVYLGVVDVVDAGGQPLDHLMAEIHHAQVFLVPADQRAAVAAQAGTDGRPGWQCFGGPAIAFGTGHNGRRLRGFTGEAGLIAGWVPGQDPVVYPDNAGVLMAPGDVLVLQVHYHYDQAPAPDQSTLALQTAPGTSNVHQLDIINPLGPVEIPCLPGTQAALCDRSAAIADATQRFGPVGGVENALLGLCGQTAANLTAGFDGVAHSSCDTRVPESGQIIAVMGHMHTLGKSIRLTLDPASPKPTVLLDIPTWNFDWQLNYALASPLHVNAGQTIRLDCTWDRSLDPNRPQRYIVFAEGTEDEMCFATYAIIPDGA